MMSESSSWKDALSERDALVAGACLRAAVDGPFFSDSEFSIIFGFEREEIRKLRRLVAVHQR